MLIALDHGGQARLDKTVFHARWLPVLDDPRDAQRLAQLEAAMPPICRAEYKPKREPPAPHALLSSFINGICDALVRSWARSAIPSLLIQDDDPANRWLAALFDDDPLVKAPPARLHALSISHRAWMRSLHAAGDANFCISFRLEAPHQQGDSTASWKLDYMLQARDDPSLIIPAETVWKTRSSALTHLNHRFKNPQEKLLAGLGYAARLFPPIATSLKEKHPTHLSLSTQEAYTFLREAAPLLQSAGFGLLVPPWWNKPGSQLGVRLRLTPTGDKQTADRVPKGDLSLRNLVNYRWELSLGDTILTEEEFNALAELKTPLVQVRGQWVRLDADQIEAAIRFWQKQQTEGQMGMLEALQYALGAHTSEGGLPIQDVSSEGWLADWLQQFDRSEKMDILSQPASLNGQLRPYQRFGYSWLNFHRRFGLGACLADDMGLGKTIQALCLLLHEKEQLGTLPAPTLLICPTSVVTNWERETRRFAPSLTTMIHQGANRLQGEDFRKAAHSVDLVLTSYVLARQDADTLQAVQWHGIILDEAQNIKNPSAKQSQAVRKFKGTFRMALTGTPVENRLSELWSIMHFLNPGYLGTREKFRSEFILPIERYNEEEATQRLKKLIAPFILRRVKTDPRVIQDLPEKVEVKEYCTLSEEQATLYEAVVQDVMKKIEEEEGIQRRGLVLSMLTQLKQICNHPLQYLHQTSGNGQISDDLDGRSGKLERLTELLEEVLAEGDRALIFTQYAEMGELLAAYLPRALGCAAMFLHGGTPVKTRDWMVRRFQEDEHAPSLFILSLKAGGTGLNLTRASHVFHFDRWWNPAVEDQATDRAFRIGQKRNVQVRKLICVGTLEEMIDNMIENKKGLSQAIIGSGEQWLTELSTDELRQLVTLRRS
ncbi:MAG: DEAD/DEAH box helicase [Anaerolineae bacterium]|nr:DEAD/DEAH box helicase [Anaerolineae bacterium]